MTITDAEPLTSTTTETCGNAGRRGVDFSAVWQLTSMSLGAGVFTIPMVYAQLGWLHASFWILVMGFFAAWAMERLLDISLQTGKCGYEVLAEAAFGAAGKTTMSVITLVTTFIAAISYIVTAKELLVNLAVAFILDVDVNSANVEILSSSKTVIVLIVFVCAAMPMTLPTQMGDTAWISKFGVCCMVMSSMFFVGRCAALIAQGCAASGVLCGDRPPVFKGSVGDVFEYAATLAFSFSVVFALFPVLQDRLENAVMANAVMSIRKSVRWSIAVCCTLYLVIGMVGSFAFGSKVNGVALLNLPLKEPLSQLITLFVGVSVWLLTAIVGFPAVSSAEYLVKTCAGSSYPSYGRAIIVFVMGVGMVLVDTYVPTKVAFTLCGALGLSVAAYVMPCILFFRLDDHGKRTLKLLTLLVALFGLALLFGSTPITVIRALAPEESATKLHLKSLICAQASDSASGFASAVKSVFVV